MLGQNNTVCRTDMTHSRHTDLTRRRNVMNNLVVAPSFNGRTADSGSAYRGSNPWGATKSFQSIYGSRPVYKVVPGNIQLATFVSGTCGNPQEHWLYDAIAGLPDHNHRC